MIIKGCISLLLIMLFMTFSNCTSFDGNVDEYYEEAYDEYMSVEPETVIDVENELDLDLKDAEVEFSMDDHGGFHGDGQQVVIMYFYDTIENQLKNNDEWNSFPLSENLECVLYGDETEFTSYSPHFTRGETNKPVLPEIKNGYWYFYDRHSESDDPKDDTYLLKRGSSNYTVAVYDCDENTLYYFERDT